jgi:ELWxxDGT repeat protein/VCBS repeat-containing protein
VGPNPGAVVSGDLNNDGRTDVVVANRDTNTVSILLSVSGRLGAPSTVTLPGRVIAATLEDMNNDGLVDIVASSFADPFTITNTVVSVLLNKGGGSFAAPITSSGSVVTIGNQAIDDVNGDGKADVVVGNASASFVSVFLGDGTGKLAAPFNSATNGTPANVALSDIDLDGKIDLIYTVGSNTIVQPGKGDGTFLTPVFSGTMPNSVSGLTGGDLNGDGLDDGVVALSGNNGFAVLLNTSSNTLAGITTVADSFAAKEAGGVANGTLGFDASGNVLTNDIGTGLTVVGISWLGGATGAVGGKIGSPVAGGTLGSLTMAADGSFNYVVNQVGAQNLGQGGVNNDNFAYTVQDSKGNRATGILTIQVNGANDAPIASVVPNQTFVAGQFRSFTIPSFTDPEFNGITYGFTLTGGAPLPSWLTVAGTTFSGTPSSMDTGTVSLDVKGTDSFGLSASTTFSINVRTTLYSITAVDRVKYEGTGGKMPFQFNVTRTGDLSGTQTVDWFVNGVGVAPTDDADFVGGFAPFGTLTFNANETSKSLIIDVNGDAIPEGNEIFAVNLLATTPGTGVLTGSAQASVVDDDTAARVTNSVLFGAPTPGKGYEPWVSDLTTGGTKLVRDIHPGVRGSYPGSFRTSDPVAFGHGTLFAATDNTHGSELWYSDGTAAGTRMIIDLLPNIPGAGLNPRYMTRIGGKVFFTGVTAGSAARELWITDGTTAGTHQVKDINAGYGRSSPQQLTAFNDKLLFSAYDPAFGRELWISDGTEAGTTRVKDINTGNNGAFSSSPQNFAILGSVALFAASGSNGRELWRTDGTENGTYQVADIFAGGSSSNPTNLTVLGDKLIFQATNAANGAELWVTDGTAAGTSLLADTNAGSASGSPNYLAVLGNKAVFTAGSPTGSDLWITDGTVLGTSVLASSALPNAFRYQTTLGNKVLFFGTEASGGRELWSTDGTVAGTGRLVDIYPGPVNSRPQDFRPVGDKLVFTAIDPVNGSSLWVTDGTAAGTSRLGTPYPGFDPGSAPIVRGRSQPGTRINALNGRTLFVAGNDVNNAGNIEDRILWTTGGTAASTFPLLSSTGTPIVMGHSRDQQDGLNTYPMITLGGRMLFTAFDTTRGFELWVTDGLSGGAGTAPLVDIYAGTSGSYATNFSALDSGHVLFNARSVGIGYELWISDGTAAGTSLVKDINVGNANSSSYPNNFRSLNNGKALFTAHDGVNGQELWITDGSAAGTSMVKDINTNPGESSFPRNLTLLSSTNVLFFAQDNAANPLALWRTDGTAAGTSMIKNVTYPELRRVGGPLTVMGGKAFFAGDDGVNGQQLWVSDGTTAGTSVVAPINPSAASRPSEITVLNGNRILFAADNATSGRELWISDGTAPGTSLLSDIVVGAGGSNPDNLAALGSKMLFAADSVTKGRELWVTDGTAAGTSMLLDINKGAGNSSPNAISVRNGLAFFQANDGTSGYELWVSDGTTAGTRIVRNLNTYQPSQRPGNLVAFEAPVFTAGVANLDLTAKDATKLEGSGTGVNFTFRVGRTGDTSGAVSATWTVTPLLPDPTSPEDFTATTFPSGVVSFAAGETVKLITINVAGDTLIEHDEQFLVTLSAPTGGAVIARDTALGTILDNDAMVSVAALDATKFEGDSGTVGLTFQATRVGYLGTTHTVNWVVKAGPVNTANTVDFGGALPSGTITFAPGVTTQKFTVNATGDTTVELDEQFTVNLTTPSTGLTIGTGTAIGTLLNDDDSLSIAPVLASQFEGNSGATGFQFTVTRAGSATDAVSASWAVTGTGLDPATASDFVGGVLPSGTVSLAAGETSKTFTIDVQGDTTIEANESFNVTLSNPIGTTLAKSIAKATILTDDATLAIAANTASAFEGHSGVTPFTFAVTRVGDTSSTLKVNYTVAGSGTKAADAADFDGAALPSGSVIFAAGETAKTITVNVAGDTVVEANEDFTVTISTAAAVTITTASATSSIRNDDATLSITAAAPSLVEGNTGTKGAKFTVTRAGYTGGTASASFAVTGNGFTPADAADFGGTLPSGTVSFLAGETSKTITINVTGDTTIEYDEGFRVTLSNAVNSTVGTASAAMVILDDDAIQGTSGNDNLFGTVNPDTIRMGAGLDSVTALAGLDFLQWTPAALGSAAVNMTTLMDFDPSIGEKIDLSLLDAIAATPVNDAFTFIGNIKFSGTPGELRWQTQGSDVLIQGNTNTNPTAELTILVKNFAAADAGWFTL